MSSLRPNRLRTSVILGFVVLIGASLNCRTVLAEVVACESLFSEPRIHDWKTDTIVRLRFVWQDGFGDVMNAIGLASELSGASHFVSIPVVIDNSAYFSEFKRIVLGLKDDENSSVTYNKIEIVDGQSLRGKNLRAEKRIQISRESAGNIAFRQGEADFNIYVEEPGAESAALSSSDFSELIRGQAITDKNGRFHLRINPGLRTGDFGINLPKLSRSSIDKQAIIARLAGSARTKLPLGIAKGSWGFIYRHKFSGDQGRQYLGALASAIQNKGIQKPIFIFDFSHTTGIGFFGKRFDSIARLFGGYGQAFNHILPDGRYLKSQGPQRSPVTIVHLGLTDHQTFVDVMNASDLPVAVTGTQSLFEAISLGRPFYYEVLPWKMNLAFGLADHALQHFDYYEAKFIIGLLIGDADYLGDIANFERLKASIQLGETVPWRLIEANRKQYLALLFFSEEKQRLMARFSRSLQQTPTLAASVDRTLDAFLTDRNSSKTAK